MHGWRGKILRVDLTRGVVDENSLDPQVARDYVGGRGLGIFYLLNEVDAGCDPLGPENVLIMATGPLTGTKAPTGARYMVMTKSPLTGSITCSNSGGQFPAELKKAGVDMIIFQGQADDLCTRDRFQYLSNQVALLFAPSLDDDHVRGCCLHLGKCVGAGSCNPDYLNAWLAREEALYTLGEEWLAGENKYTGGIHSGCRGKAVKLYSCYDD